MTIQSNHTQSQNRSNRTGQIVILSLLIVGIGFLFLAILSTVELVQLRFFGHETVGYVIRQEVVKESIERYEDGEEYDEDIESYYAIVSYRTNQGTFTIRSYDSGTYAPLYPTDSQITVVHPPRHPEKARIQQEITGFRGIFGPLMFFIFGAALIGTSRMITFFR